MLKLYTIPISFVVLFGFSQCKTTNTSIKTSKTIHMDTSMNETVYYQEWIAGVKGGGSGINLYINKSILPDNPLEAFFRHKKVKLTINNSFYLAAFKTDKNELKDYVSDAELKNEYGNKVPELMKDFPFDLKNNEAVISYDDNGTIKYLRLENIFNKPMLAYPSAPNNNIKL